MQQIDACELTVNLLVLSTLLVNSTELSFVFSCFEQNCDSSLRRKREAQKVSDMATVMSPAIRVRILDAGSTLTPTDTLPSYYQTEETPLHYQTKNYRSKKN